MLQLCLEDTRCRKIIGTLEEASAED